MLSNRQLETIADFLADVKTDDDESAMTLQNLIAEVRHESKKSADDKAGDAETVLRAEYFSHVRGLALEVFQNIANGTLEDRDALESWIHQTLDSDGWVFQTHSAIKVLLFSDNDGAYVENFGSDGLSTDGCINWSAMAFAAMEADLKADLELFNQEDESVFEWIGDESERDEDDDADETVGRIEKAEQAIGEFKRCGYKTD